ncbi:MAG: imidazole glycerol phosphate synthase subunit HisH [Clostridia bacterium]
MIAIIDYGVGNLFSLKSSLRYLGVESIVTGDVTEIKRADKIILPGVGAFADAIKKLKECGLDKVIVEEVATGKPLLGICLGMQMLFDKSYEYGVHVGLGLIKGEVCPLTAEIVGDLKIPQIGWNSLNIVKDSPILKYINNGEYVYYVHSYYATNCAQSTTATSEYGIEVTGAVQCGNVFGTQFHPEKSGDTGLRILKAFSEL